MDFFYGDQSEFFSFYRIPKLLITDKRFKSLSCESKLLYGLLIDRMSLIRATYQERSPFRTGTGRLSSNDPSGKVEGRGEGAPNSFSER